MAKTRSVNLHDLEPEIRALIADASVAGDEVVIMGDGQPLAKIIPMNTLTDLDAGAPLEGSIVFHDDLLDPIDAEWQMGRTL
jgi:antitoxin (DNA-binding transcriptional repressor) of toxin-antitoxin stability system